MTTSDIPEGYLEIGHVRRAHGIGGDVFVQLVTNRAERLDVGSRLHSANGELTVEDSRLLPNGRWVVKFAEIPDRTAAEGWNNVALHGAPIVDDDTLWIHDLIGAKVVEADGTDRGRCIGVLDNPAADILELETGALVPVNFVTGFERGVITVEVPVGLFELADEQPGR